jgi:plasmid stabilization system protein ParE
MTYQVALLPLAEEDLEAAYLWAAAHAPEAAANWLGRFQAALRTLTEFPERCTLAPEHRKVNRPLRQLLFGKRPNVFRAVFLIENGRVNILRIRRASQKLLAERELR